jgi:hypothetical protein
MPPLLSQRQALMDDAEESDSKKFKVDEAPLNGAHDGDDAKKAMVEDAADD